MYLDYDESRPDTPRVPTTLTRLERFLLAVVAYQCLLLLYFLAPAGAVNDTKAPPPDQPLQFVRVEPLVPREVQPKRPAPLADLDRRTTTPVPVPKARNNDPLSKGNTPEKVIAAPPEQPRAAETAQPVMGPSLNEAPPAPPRIRGGLLNQAMNNLERAKMSENYDNPNGGAGDQGQDIQFDSKGVDFGAWLRRFKAQVTSNWAIPQVADVIHGHVVIQMKILRNGTIVNPHILKSSGTQALDDAALGALKLSNPTMTLPVAYPGESIDPFIVTFYYLAPNERVPMSER